MKFSHNKLLVLCIFCLTSNLTFAQKLKEHLFIYDSQNNSFKITTDNQPYAVFLNDTLVLKGYFDAVYPTNFLFATKDSVYLLTPEQILDIHPIDFNTNTTTNYSKTGNSVLKAGGIVLITIGALLSPAAIAALILEPASGLVFGAFTGGLLTGGILMTSKANKNIKQTQAIPEIIHYQNKSRYRLYIIKSPI